MNNSLRHRLAWWLLFFIVNTHGIINRPKIFSMKKQIRSFKYAINGFKIAINEERNFRIHLIALIAVLIAAYIFKITPTEWITILLSIGLVITCELINTAIENLADIISPDYNTQIKKVKDISAASVLFASICTFIIALVIFIPKL